MRIYLYHNEYLDGGHINVIKIINDKNYTIEPNANLRDANLHGANLRNANLHSAYHIHSIYIANMSSRGDYVYAVEHETELMIMTGCFWGAFAKFKADVLAKKERNSLYVLVGLPSIQLLNDYLYPDNPKE